MKVRRTYPDDAPLIDDLLERAYPKLMAEAYREEVLSAALPFLKKSNTELLKSGTYYVAVESERMDPRTSWQLRSHFGHCLSQALCDRPDLRKARCWATNL